MIDSHKKVSLGFTDQEFNPGLHICQIYGEDSERVEVILQLLLTGLVSGEAVSCFSNTMSKDIVNELLASHGISGLTAIQSGALQIAPTDSVYFKNNQFDPDSMIATIDDYFQKMNGQNYSGVRIVGEMTPKVESIEGGNRLLEYESRVSLYLHDHPITTVCQYDSRQFSGNIIMDVLKVHPLMIVRGRVLHNPFYIPPQEYLASIGIH